mmetsp:Transcript_21786/g.43585  ORF Transcript_21786/g.43585 Transcript_21786/m.43585 type:complete len:409 (-) Transcript_21786:206-1432(-)
MDMSCDLCGIASNNMVKMIDAVADFFTVDGRRAPNEPGKFRHAATKDYYHRHAHRRIQVDKTTKFPLHDNKVKGEAAILLCETEVEAPPPALARSPFDPVCSNNSIELKSPAAKINGHGLNRNEHGDTTLIDDDRESDAQSIHSVPSLFSSEVSEENDERKRCMMHRDTIPQFDATSQRSLQEDPIDTVVAWSFLAAALASPAPSSVLKNNDSSSSNKKKSEIVNVWDDDTGSSFSISNELSLGNDDKHDLDTRSQTGILLTLSSTTSDRSIPLTTVDRETDAQSIHSIPSLFSSEANEDKRSSWQGDDIPQFDASSQKSSKEDPTDNVMAWSVLAAVLASPAPSSVLKNNESLASTKRREIVNLWEDDATSTFSINDELSIETLDMNESDTRNQNDILLDCTQKHAN